MTIVSRDSVRTSGRGTKCHNPIYRVVLSSYVTRGPPKTVYRFSASAWLRVFRRARIRTLLQHIIRPLFVLLRAPYTISQDSQFK